MARAKYDPLEAAKIGVLGEKPRTPDPVQPVASETLDSQAFKSEETTKDEAPVIKTKQVLVCRAPRYRILDQIRISIDGNLCTFRKGDIIDSAGYGAEQGIARLQRQGLKVEQVKD